MERDLAGIHPLPLLRPGPSHTSAGPEKKKRELGYTLKCWKADSSFNHLVLPYNR